MSSLNCFKRQITDLHRPDGVRREPPWDGVSLGQSETVGQETLEWTADKVPASEAGGQSKFNGVQCDSSRPASSSAIHALKTNSLSSRYRMKLRNAGGAYISNSSPMSTFRTCVKGNSERSASQVRKKGSKIQLHARELSSSQQPAPPPAEDYDARDQQVDQAPGGHATRFGFSCLVRSHSDSTCLSVKAKPPPDSSVGQENDLTPQLPPPSQTPSLNSENSALKQPSPQQTEVFRAPAPRLPTPQLTDRQTPIGYNPLPQAPPLGPYFTPGPSAYVGGQVTQSPGLCPHISVSYDLSGRGFCYPSPQLSTCSMLVPYHGGYLKEFEVRRCSYDGCGANGAMILPSTSGPMSGTRVGKEYGLPHNSPMSFNSDAGYHHPSRLGQSPPFSGSGGGGINSMERSSSQGQQQQQQQNQPHFSQPVYSGRVQLPPPRSAATMPPTPLSQTKHNGIHRPDTVWSGEGAPDRTSASTAPAAPLPIRRQFGGISSPPPNLNRDFVKRPAGRKPPSYNAALESLRSHRGGQGGEDPSRTSRDSGAGYSQPYASTLPIPIPTSALPNQPTVQQRQHHHKQHQPSNKQNDQELTVEDLRSIVNRQLTNIEAQKKDILKKTQRINELRSKLKPILTMPARCSTHSTTDSLPPMYQVPETVLPWSGFEMTREDEVNLNKLRQLRGHTEHLRLENEALAAEAHTLHNQTAAKERELASCLRRSEEMQGKISLIREWCQWLASPPGALRPMPSSSPSFEVADDALRWNTAFSEISHLDQSIRRLQEPQGAAGASSGSTSREACSSVPPETSPRHVTLPPRPSSVHRPSAIGSSHTTCNGAPERIIPPIPSPRLSRASSAAAVDETSRQQQPPARTPPNAHPGGPQPGTPQPQRPPSIASNASVASTSASTRLKAPRYASRKFISDTYLNPQRRDTIEKYKRSATEHLQENLASQNAALTAPPPSAVADTVPRPESATPPSQLGVEVVLPEAQHLTIKSSPPTAGNATRSSAVPYREECGSPTSSTSSSSSSSSSLPFVDSDHNLQEMKSADVSEETEDSASVDTDAINKASVAPDENKEEEEEEEEEEQEATSQDGKGAAAADFRAADTGITTKSILRGASGAGGRSPDLKSTGPAEGKRKGVRFHPLALLLDAALEGDLQLVKKAALEVSDVSEPNDEGITALHNAVCAGRADVADFLVREVGADVNAGDTDGWTPLHCAASCGNVQLAKLLVEHGAALHSRTLSDHETALEKCDQGDHDAECEKYLAAEEDLLGAANEGRVYGIFPRGLEAAGPGSHDAQIESDELPIWPNEELRIIDRTPANEVEWMLAENSDGHQGLVPRAYISRFRLLRIPPASRPIPARSPSPEGHSCSPLTLVESPSSGRTTPQMVELSGGSEMEFQVESLDESTGDSRDDEVTVDLIQDSENFTAAGTGYAGATSASDGEAEEYSPPNSITISDDDDVEERNPSTEKSKQSDSTENSSLPVEDALIRTAM